MKRPRNDAAVHDVESCLMQHPDERWSAEVVKMGTDEPRPPLTSQAAMEALDIYRRQGEHPVLVDEWPDHAKRFHRIGEVLQDVEHPQRVNRARLEIQFLLRRSLTQVDAEAFLALRHRLDEGSIPSTS